MKRSIPAQRASALLSVLVPGAIGVLVLARTLLFYVGQDAASALLVVGMGLGLGVGLGDLLLRTRRALRLEQEVAALPGAPAEEDLAGFSPVLRDLLRARIENAPMPFRAESITPYLVGLMVMLGLLGTLLGLFETLAGAGHALTASTNVDALRSGLSEPMRGLTRSFGCSAAGVSASAMLGLAAALVRRREAQVLVQVHSFANRALRHLSPARSQASALSRLADQGSALPQAASALENVAQQLSGLAERWEVAHRTAADAQQKSLEAALQGVRAEMAKTTAATARELESALGKQLANMVQKTSELVAGHLEKTARAMERELVTRREDDAALRKELAEDLATVRDSVAQSSRAQSELIAAQMRGLDQALSQRAEQQTEQLAAERRQAEAHIATLAEASRALAERLEEDARTRRHENGRLFDALAARLDAAGSHLGQIADRVGEQLGARLQNESQLAERLGAAMSLFEANGKALEEALVRQELAVESLVAQARKQLEDTAQAAQEGAQAALARVVALAGEQSERLIQLEKQLEASQAQHALGLSQSLSAQAERLGQGLEATTASVQQAAELLKASSVEMGAVAELFAKSVERQREAANAWLESLGELEGAVERAGRGAAADALGDQLASTQEVFARQLQFQRELFEQLRTLRAASATVHGEHDVSA